MIDLGTTDFFIGVPSMPRNQFRKYSTRLFDEWEEHVSRNLELPDYSLALEVEEGSVKGVGRIVAALGALYLGIGNYGDFIQGIQTIRSQVSSVGDYLAEQAGGPFKASGCETKIRKRSGSLGQLQSLFAKVQRREMTTEEAMLQAEALFGDEAADAPGFMSDLQRSIERTPLFHQQLPLLPSAMEQGMGFSTLEKKRKSRSPPSLPVVPPPQHLRVEVWRDSKHGQRKVRVIQL
ncbi:hypothetical protein ACLSSQ_05885 [Azospira sp. APE16]|uniref:hypothetical protein n=1 Tax=Azospira sp. APE16 TaxID=3394231 RepID=UPI003A4D7C15